MKELLQKYVFDKYSKEGNVGIFFSGFDKNGTQIFSNGVFQTQETLESVLENIYDGIIAEHEQNINMIAVDVISEKEELTNPNDILSTDIKNYGFLLVSLNDESSGIILPNTSGVADAKNSLSLIKQKYELSGNVSIYRFKTDRFVIRKE
ncbi:hypothetical protein [Candidatus Absconditicoccus praedator]|uniref:hypothetical protein n=1 Tax=Candidatus Absconditicoccus praedator TaxID=2735562 RepID=UPI001E4B9F0B|nr:hypothetical protein [Candidatus Absconditicoccus praedator]UFX82665.1 hypothetical protein HLG78_00745 [Candidatus Absconditicoccus praedator]